jgi:hypothetical protein
MAKLVALRARASEKPRANLDLVFRGGLKRLSESRSFLSTKRRP